MTRLEKVKTGQSVRLGTRTDFRTVTSHGPGYCHGIRVTFADGSSVTALPSTLVEVK